MDKFTLPIYLNQKYVFDLLAIIEDGFSQIESVKAGQTSDILTSKGVSGEIGVNNVFAFLKFGLGGNYTKENKTNQQEEKSREKIHTPNSLFSKLREYLHQNQHIVKNNYLNSKTGEFIEVKLSLKKNPLIDSLAGFSSLMKLAVMFDDSTPALKKGGQKSPSNSNTKVLTQMESLNDQLKDEGSIDLIGTYKSENENFKVVLTLDKSYLGDITLSDIADGEFSVIGKVTRVLQKDSDETVNLLRKTSLSKLNSALLDQMFSAFNNMEESGIKNQEIVTEINPPVIQIIPIAIFT